MNGSNITDQFIDLLYQIKEDTVYEPAQKQVKRCLLDYLGVTICGSKMLNNKGRDLLSYYGSYNEGSTAIGFDSKTNLITASLINALSAHIADLDDGVRQASMHPGASVFSVLLPLAQKEIISPEKFAKGIIVGYEAGIRLATSIQPSHRNAGYHATGSCGTIGVAMAVSSALNYNKEQMKNALSAACTSSSGMLNVTKGSSELKPFNPAQATVSGLNAAFIARANFKGSDDVLAGEWGFLSMVSSDVDESRLVNFPGSKRSIENVYFKPYAACRHAHPVIEAVLNIRNRNNISADLIEKISVETYQLATKGHDHTQIEGVTSAKMSTPYSTAVAIINGKADIHEFSSDRIKNEKILKLAEKVEVNLDHSINNLVPEKRAADVSIIMKDGSVYKDRVDLAKGEPENPLTDDEIEAKFLSLATFGGKSEKEAVGLADSVRMIGKDLKPLLSRL